MTSINVNTINCRLCGELATYKFNKIVLNNIDVSYFECHKCKSLQTENPFWLNIAYENHISLYDTGSARRNLDNLSAIFILCKLFRLNNVLDFGGGGGLLCRLLRDININCFSTDAYSEPVYNQGFKHADFHTPDLVTAFEVIEHFVNPAIDLDSIFSRNSKSILITTGIYNENDMNWWYLSPESGQHIFFISERGINHISHIYGYSYYHFGNYTYFTKNRLNKITALFVRTLLRKPLRRIILGMTMLIPTFGIENDLNKLRNIKK